LRKYELKKEQKLIESNNIGTFYKFVNKKLSCKAGIGALRDTAGKRLTADSGTATALNEAELRPPCVRDLMTMEEVGSRRLTSLVHYGCRISFPGRPNRSRLVWHGRLLRPALLDDVVSNTLLTRLGIDTNSYQNLRLYRDANYTSKMWESGKILQNGNFP